jgi:hypothetical protein
MVYRILYSRFVLKHSLSPTLPYIRLLVGGAFRGYDGTLVSLLEMEQQLPLSEAVSNRRVDCFMIYFKILSLLNKHC